MFFFLQSPFVALDAQDEGVLADLLFGDVARIEVFQDLGLVVVQGELDLLDEGHAHDELEFVKQHGLLGAHLVGLGLGHVDLALGDAHVELGALAQAGPGLDVFQVLGRQFLLFLGQLDQGFDHAELEVGGGQALEAGIDDLEVGQYGDVDQFLAGLDLEGGQQRVPGAGGEVQVVVLAVAVGVAVVGVLLQGGDGRRGESWGWRRWPRPRRSRRRCCGIWAGSGRRWC